MTGGGESSGIKIANNKRSKCALEGIKNSFSFISSLLRFSLLLNLHHFASRTVAFNNLWIEEVFDGLRCTLNFCGAVCVSAKFQKDFFCCREGKKNKKKSTPSFDTLL